MNRLIATIFLAVLATGTISGCASDGIYDGRYVDYSMQGVPYGEDMQFRIEREDGRNDVIRIEARR